MAEFKIGDKVKHKRYSLCGEVVEGAVSRIRVRVKDGSDAYYTTADWEPYTPKQPHPHADIIKAWADGEEVECLSVPGKWVEVPVPSFAPENQYRIKPRPETVRFRLYLRSHPMNVKPTVETWDDPNWKDTQRINGFIRWLGDWQEVEL